MDCDINVDVEPGYVRFKESGHKPDEDAVIELASWVVKQAAIDYRLAIRNMMKYSDESPQYKEARKLRNDVVRFSRSDWFNLLVPLEDMTSERFLKMSIDRQIAPTSIT